MKNLYKTYIEFKPGTESPGMFLNEHSFNMHKLNNKQCLNQILDRELDTQKAVQKVVDAYHGHMNALSPDVQASIKIASQIRPVSNTVQFPNVGEKINLQNLYDFEPLVTSEHLTNSLDFLTTFSEVVAPLKDFLTNPTFFVGLSSVVIVRNQFVGKNYLWQRFFDEMVNYFVDLSENWMALKEDVRDFINDPSWDWYLDTFWACFCNIYWVIWNLMQIAAFGFIYYKIIYFILSFW